MKNFVTAVVAALIGASVSLQVLAGTPVFAPPNTLPTDTLSGGIVIGDFNGDGRPDFVAINFTTITVYLNNGDGAFTKGTAPNVSANASLGVAADFNGDGKIDVIITNVIGNNAFFLAGRGDGTFNAPVSIIIGSQPFGIAAHDLNGDGKLDLVVSLNGLAKIAIHTGNGDGTFTPVGIYNVGLDARALTLGDFNNDGKPDITVANFGSNSVSILFGNGNGTFSPAQNFPVGPGPQSVAAGDFNGDGNLDLVTANNDANTVSVLLGNGNGTFAPGVTYTVGVKPRYTAIADFDGDGKLDLAVTSNQDNYFSILAGVGDGTFAPAVNFATGSTPNDIHAADLNGDGKPDLIVANFVGASDSVFINQSPQCQQPGCPGAGGAVIEFYNTNLDNFFVTADPAEQLAVVRGAAGPGWSVTGNFFRAGGSSLVCRFYGSISPGPNSHFYTIEPAECQALKDLQASTSATQKRWNFESNDFASTIPAAGQCLVGQAPVYRAYNDGFARGIDSNHRFTSNLEAYQSQIAKGWKAEGVVMCAP